MKKQDAGGFHRMVHFLVLFVEQVECYFKLVGRFTWRMARSKQNQRRINEGRSDLQRFYNVK